MAGASWIFHGGRRILFIDFSHSDAAQILATIEQAKPLISSQPPNSILCLVETTQSKYSLETANALKEFTLFNKPYIKMTAVVGVEGLQKVILSAVVVFTKRTNLIIQQSRAEALDFLISVK